MRAARNCLANVVICDTAKAPEYLAGPLATLLRTGSPSEHVLELCCDESGLPEGAAKHLIAISQPDVRM